MYYFCTYFDKNYLSQGLVLRESLAQHLPKRFILYVLSLDNYVYDFFQKNYFEGVQVIPLHDIEQKYPELLAVKPHRKNYEYYFTLTPTLPWYILEQHQEVDMITYIDADIYFYHSPVVLFEELGDDSILIIPHFFSEANKYQEIHGKYNVVFNTFKRDSYGLACLDWWRHSCIEWCYDYVEGDKFADQKYLDKFPLLFQKVKICQNRGANLAVFNIDNITLSKKNSYYYVNDTALVFYHFHHLRRFHKYFFNPNLPKLELYKDKLLIEIYIKYIGVIKKYEKKYKLLPNKAIRANTKYLKGSKLMYWLIYNFSIIHLPFYQGVIRLEKYYKKVSFLRNLFRFKVKANKS